MKVIHSNRRGAGIHSPYAYRLVTGAIFAPEAGAEEAALRSLRPRRLRKQAMLAQRLASFLKPRQVVIAGDSSFWSRVFNHIPEKITFAESSAFSALPAGPGSQLVVWSEAPQLSAEIPQYGDVSFWILPGTDREPMARFLAFLRESPAVQVTLEVFRTGIVVFNGDLQKQDYILHNRY